VGEEERLREWYSSREEGAYSALKPEVLFFDQLVERHFLRGIASRGLRPGELEVLDIGTGDGDFLRRMLNWGFERERLHGIELAPPRVERARALSPGLDIVEGNAESLPYDDSRFDIVCQNVVFSSIRDDGMRKNVAKEMIRVAKPNGLIFWQDIAKMGADEKMRAVTKTDIAGLFPNCLPALRSAAVHPKVRRNALKLGWWFAHFCEALPLGRTHLIGMIEVRK